MNAYDDLGPGLHVLRDADPVARATIMAAAMRAELCATEEQAEAALVDRSALPAVDLSTLITLQVLSRRVARAERIAARTNERALADVEERLAAAGLAGPQTVRERADAVASARAALARAEAAQAEHEAGESALEAALADDARAEDVESDGDGPGVAGPGRNRRPRRPPPPPAVRRSRALGVLVGSFGAALVVLGLDALPLWAALLLPLVSALWALRYLRPRAQDDAGERSEASSLLAEMSASAEELFGARRAQQEMADQAVLLAAERARAEEELRLASRAWQDLAGPDADPADVDSVVRRFDTQPVNALSLASETAGLRAAEAVVEQLRQRWAAVWDGLGVPRPHAGSPESAADELVDRLSRPVVLVGPAVRLGTDLARVAPAAPVVVLEGPLSASPEGGTEPAVS